MEISLTFWINIGSLTGRNGKGIYVYFVANFSEELISFGTWSDGHLSIKSVSTVGKRCGAFAGKVLNKETVTIMMLITLEFDESVSYVVMTISLSFVSVDQVSV